MLNVLGVVFTSNNKNIKSIASLPGFYSSSKGVSSLNSSLPHFPTPPPHQICHLAFFPRDCLLSHLAPSRHPLQCCLLALPSPFLCQVSQALVQMSLGSAHTRISLRCMLDKSESYLLLFLFTLFTQKTFSQVLFSRRLSYLPTSFCLGECLVIFSCF